MYCRPASIASATTASSPAALGFATSRAPANCSTHQSRRAIPPTPTRLINRVGVGGIALRLWCVEQFAGARDVANPSAAGEEAVVADAMEAGRQYMDQEAADELAGGERHGLLPMAATGAIVLPFEADAFP